MACRPERSGCARGERLLRRALAGALAAVLLLAGPLQAAETGGRARPQGTTDKRAREAARLAIPWKALPSNVRPTVSEVVGGATLYRQMPTRVIDCDADLYTYLIDRPELVVGAWNVMGVSRLKLERVAPDRFNVTDAAGAVGEVRVVHRSGGGVDARGKRQPLTMVLLASGVYQAPPMPQPIRGKSVLLLRADALDEANGRSYVTTRLDSFMRFGGPATRVAAKTLSPLIGRTADHNFVETMRFVSLFSRTAETNPSGMARLAGHLRHVDEPTRREFASMCQQTADRYALRRASRHRVAITPAMATVR